MKSRRIALQCLIITESLMVFRMKSSNATLETWFTTQHNPKAAETKLGNYHFHEYKNDDENHTSFPFSWFSRAILLVRFKYFKNSWKKSFQTLISYHWLVMVYLNVSLIIKCTRKNVFFFFSLKMENPLRFHL